MSPFIMPYIFFSLFLRRHWSGPCWSVLVFQGEAHKAKAKNSLNQSARKFCILTWVRREIIGELVCMSKPGQLLRIYFLFFLFFCFWDGFILLRDTHNFPGDATVLIREDHCLLLVRFQVSVAFVLSTSRIFIHNLGEDSCRSCVQVKQFYPSQIENE